MRLTLLTAVLVLPLLTVPGRAEKLPVESFALPPAFSQMTLSRDGKYVAYTLEYEGAERVFFREVEGEGKVLGVEVPTPHAHLFGKIGGITWISSKRLLIRAFSGYIAVDRDGKDYAYLTGSARVYRPNRQDNQMIYAGGVLWTDRLGNSDEVMLTEFDHRAERPRTGWIVQQTPNVMLMNTRTGTYRMREDNPGDIAAWAADREGKIRLAFRIKGKQRQVLFRATPESAWRMLAGLGEDPLASEVMGFTADGTQLYVAKIAENGRFALHYYDPVADKLGELILGHELYDIGSSNGTRLIHAVDGRLLGIRYVTDITRFLWLDDGFAEIQAQIDATLPNAVNHITGITDDEQLMLVLSASARNPGTHYLYDRAQGVLRKFVDTMPWLKPETLAEMMPLRLTARDGLRLHGYLTTPPGREMKNLPMVVMPHGGPWARDHYGFDPLVQFLANRGYAVLQVNYRGSVGYGREFYEKGFRQVGTGMQEDIEDAVRFAIARGIADPKRVGIMGGSFGGYSTLMGLIRTPELYRCGINLAGVTDWSKIIRHSAEMSPMGFAFNVERIGDPKSDAGMLRAISPVHHVDRIQAPLLIIHGRDDPIVPHDQARDLMRALDRAGKKYESLSKFNEQHGIYNFKNRIELYSRIEQFLAAHMAAD